MTFEKFQTLSEDTKIKKLIIAFEKVALRASKDRWIFRCCRNYAIFHTIYHEFMELMCNIRSFAYFLLDDEDIESRPACFSHVPSMGGIDFLVTDLELMLDMFYTCLSSYAIRGDEKLHIMFELSYTINNLLKVFEKRYSE